MFGHYDYETRAALVGVLATALALTVLSILLPADWHLAAATSVSSLLVAGAVLYACGRIERAIGHLDELLHHPNGPAVNGHDDGLS